MWKRPGLKRPSGEKTLVENDRVEKTGAKDLVGETPREERTGMEETAVEETGEKRPSTKK